MINLDGTLKGYEFPKGYHPLEDDTPMYARLQGEDLIDFPISPDWVRHFANQGITTDYPKEFYLDKKIEQPNEYSNNDSIYNNTLECKGGGGRKGVVKGDFEQLKGMVLHLQAKLNEHKEHSKNKGYKY
ncbi:hypothetical protein LCGC14_0396310 [marine sediment metagenome]|uniref:Uncharacterized protein n=1 Tax=marine sediment metagenome TaxID=412755 RepID=A0A0F9T3V9_9ZZZZ